MIVAYTILQGILLAVSEKEERKKYYVPIKTMCSVAFVAIAICFAIESGNREYFLWMLPSLLLCLLGDVFMAMYNKGRRKRHMILGLLLFLAAHIGYLVMLYHYHPMISPLDIVLPLSGLALVLAISYLLRLHLGKLRVPVAVYAFFISALCARGIHYMTTVSTLSALCMGAGAMLFFVSDFLILFLYFYHFKNKRNKPIVHYLNLLTYYYALLLFDFSILNF